MARPYSLDLRERVVAAVVSGQSCRFVAARFGVSVSSVVKWWQRLRATGSPAPGKMGGHRGYVLEAERDWLLARVAADPSLTLAALRRELAERGTRVSTDTVWRYLRRAGIGFKKNRVRQRAGPAGRRSAAGAVEAASGTA